jgi:hypothetical protein
MITKTISDVRDLLTELQVVGEDIRTMASRIEDEHMHAGKEAEGAARTRAHYFCQALMDLRPGIAPGKMKKFGDMLLDYFQTDPYAE